MHLHFPISPQKLLQHCSNLCRMYSSRRKIQRLTWKDGYRRSPRLSNLDAWKARKSMRVTDQDQDQDQDRLVEKEEVEEEIFEKEMGPSSRTRRGRSKTKNLRPDQQVGRESPNREQHPTNSGGQPLVLQVKDNPKDENEGQSSIVPSASWIPEKRILELIIDILQRRDTYEIFAEPVDPHGVEDYYEIIKEPMDFGTMRAKLHEGMYKNLEDFERDAFLISRNAMHFNSSGTIYFRQARAIHELSKKVFQVLKTEPENLESEFSASRSRPGRRTRSKSIFSLCPKRSNSSFDQSSKTVPCSSSRPSNIRRSFQATPGCSGRATPTNTYDHEILSGAKDSRWASSFKEDQRSTYMSFPNDSIASTIYSNPKTLMHVNQQDISYRESLMFFVKGLGPTAQKIAKRKLQECQADYPDCQKPCSNNWVQAPTIKKPAGSPSTKWIFFTAETEITTMTSQHSLDHRFGHPTVLKNISPKNISDNADKGEKSCVGDGRDIHGAPGVMAPNNNGKSTHRASTGAFHTRNGINAFALFRENKIDQNDSTRIQLDSDSPRAGLRDSKFSFVGNKHTGGDNKSTSMIMDISKSDTLVQPSESASEFSQANACHMTGRKTNCLTSSSSSSLWPMKTIGVVPAGLSETKRVRHELDSQSQQCPSTEVGKSSQIGCQEALVWSQQPVAAPVSHFTFDLPYLKSRLNQMNPSAHDKYLHQFSNREVPFYDIDQREAKESALFKNSEQKSSSLDIQHTNLALQL